MIISIGNFIGIGNSQQGEEAEFTNWWQGVGDVVPLSTNYTVYDPVGAADLASSYVNLANPGTRNAVPGAAGPTLDRGWSFVDTSSQYLNSGYRVTSTSTLIIAFEDVKDSAGYAFGMLHNSPTPVRWFSLRPDASTGTRFGAGASELSVVPDMTSGIVAINQSKVYRNGEVDSGYTPAWTGGTVNKDLFIGALNNGGVAATFFNGRILKMAIYDSILSDAQVEAVVSAMQSFGKSTLHSYSNSVLSLNPYAYYPCNLKSGYTFVKDYSGNDRLAYAHVKGGWTSGHSGKYGNAMLCNAAVPNSQIQCHTVNTNVPGNFNSLNIDEFSYCAWMKLSYSALNQKLIEIWRTNNDYAAFEIRNTNEFTIHLRENGVSQDIVETNAFGTEDEWFHLICYNSKSQGKCGVYLNGVKFEFNRTLSGHVDFVNQFTEIGIIDGYIQHIIFFDRALSQSEANTLL